LKPTVFAACSRNIDFKIVNDVASNLLYLNNIYRITTFKQFIDIACYFTVNSKKIGKIP
jgi:hypothetical protein